MRTLYITLQFVNVVVIIGTLVTVILRCRRVQQQGESIHAAMLVIMHTQAEIRDYLKRGNNG